MAGRGTALTLAAAAAIAAGAAPAGAALPTAPDRELNFLHVGSPNPANGLARVVDTHGREVLLKGVNVDGIVDYWDAPDPSHPPPPDQLKPPYPSDPAAYANGKCPPDDPRVEGVMVCEFDLGQMRPLGYDAIRLNLSWSLLEPQPGKIDTEYIDRIAQIVGWARRAGIYVVLDMHQDAWSKFVYTRGEPCLGEFRSTRGYDGAPLWASQYASPACALHGVRELDPAVAEDFQKFWLDAGGIQEHYTAVLVALAKRFRDDPTVAGYELMNEPQPGFNAPPGESDTTELFPYWGKAVDGVVAQVKGFRQLFFVEPNVERNVSDQREVLAPWSAFSKYPNVVYAPHIYTGVFTADQEVASQRFQPMDAGYRATMDDAKQLGLPLWIGEFGNNPSDDGTLLPQHYTLQDKNLLGGTLWLWKENQNDTNPNAFWGVYGPPFGMGTAQPKRILITSRATPLATQGQLQSVQYDQAKGTFDVHAKSRRIGCGDLSNATVLFVPGAVTGAVVAEGARMDVFARDGAREIYVYPNGGDYRVRSGGTGGAQTGPVCPPSRSAAPPPSSNPLGLPTPHGCVRPKRFSARLHVPRHQRIVRVSAYIDGQRVVLRRGHKIRRIVVKDLPSGRRFRLKVVAVTNRGIRLISVRAYDGCKKGPPHGSRG